MIGGEGVGPSKTQPINYGPLIFYHVKEVFLAVGIPMYTQHVD